MNAPIKLNKEKIGSVTTRTFDGINEEVVIAYGKSHDIRCPECFETSSVLNIFKDPITGRLRKKDHIVLIDFKCDSCSHEWSYLAQLEI